MRTPFATWDLAGAVLAGAVRPAIAVTLRAVLLETATAQHFIPGQPQALVQTPFDASQQERSALQQPSIVQQTPDAQQLPLAQQAGADAARTGAANDAEAASTAANASREFLIFMVFPEYMCRKQRR